MTDGIIKGTGNSRYLKSVENFLEFYPTYEAFAAALSEGFLPIDLNGLNLSGWQTVGTALNKANLLTDVTAQTLGDTPALAFAALLSKVNTAQSTANTANSNANTALNAASSRARIAYGTRTGTGTTGTISFNFGFTAQFLIYSNDYLYENSDGVQRRNGRISLFTKYGLGITGSLATELGTSSQAVVSGNNNFDGTSMTVNNNTDAAGVTYSYIAIG